METLGHWTWFGITVGLLYLFLGIYYIYYANKSILARKGYTREYISGIRKDTRNTTIGIALVVPLLLILAGFIVGRLYGNLDFSEGSQMFLFAALFIVLVAPFPIISFYSTRNKYRHLAQQTGEKIAIDMGYRTLRLLFNPTLELISTVAYVIIMVLLVMNFHPAFIHLIIIWLLYSVARGTRFQVKPALKDSYIYVFVFITINQFILIFHLVRELLLIGDSAGGLLLITGIMFAGLLILKQVYYFMNVPAVGRMLK